MPFSAHRSWGPYHQHDHSQQVLVRVTGLRCACQGPHSTVALSGRQPLRADHVCGAGPEQHLLGGKGTPTSCGILLDRRLASCPHLCIYLIRYLFISIRTHEYVFCTWSGDPIPHYVLFLKFFLLRPLGARSGGSCLPPTRHGPCSACSLALHGALGGLVCMVPASAFSLRRPGAFMGEGLACLAPRGSLLPDALG